MPINFPDAPNPYDQFTSGGKTWLYTGNTWELVARETGIPNNSISSGMLQVNSVVEAKIAANAVVESKIANGVVTTAKLANSSVDSAKLAANAVTTSAISSSQVTNDKLANTSITIGNTSVSLGSTATTITGVSNLTVNDFLTINQVKEFVVLSNTTPGSATIFFQDDCSVYHFNNASANFTLNVRGQNPGSTFNDLMSVGQIATITMLVKNGATPYYLTNMQIDSTNTGRTLYWQGSSGAPTSGNANSIDVYTFVIIKTASATYDVLASQTRFS